ncbi:MAG: energy transducer TonB [Myxococcota bacterium]
MMLVAGLAWAVTTPAVPRITTDPLLPQAYRSVPPGKYPCTVDVDVSAEGRVTDVRAVECDEDALYALATAIVQWEWTPARQDGVAVASTVAYTSEFEVRSLLPRKHVVGFVGGAVHAGGAGWFGAEGRIHLGETLSVTAGVDLDRDMLEGTNEAFWLPTFRADVALSSRRRHFEHRGIYGVTLGAIGDPYGAAGGYFAFRGELMTGIPGLSVGGDAGLAMLLSDPPTFDDVGYWERFGASFVYPWLRTSLIWYAPIPRDQFVVIPREHDPVVYEPIPIVEEPPPDRDGMAFEGVRAVHWSEIEPAIGSITPTGPGFALYPPGTYTCNVRVVVDPAGKAKAVRVEKCPAAGRADAEENVKGWEWDARPDAPDVQSVFPAPIFVDREDAELVRTQSVLLLEDGKTRPLPRGANPLVYVHSRFAPDWGVTLPTRACFVDVDLDATGKVLDTRWVSGDVEVRPRVEEALRRWVFYPVAVDGELAPVRVRLSMCDA